MKTVPFSVKPIVRARKIFRAFSTRPSRRNYNSATGGRRDYNESNQKPPLSYHGAARREDYWQPPTHCVFLWTKVFEPQKVSSMRDNNTMKLRTRKLWTGPNLLQCWTSVFVNYWRIWIIRYSSLLDYFGNKKWTALTGLKVNHALKNKAPFIAVTL